MWRRSAKPLSRYMDLVLFNSTSPKWNAAKVPSIEEPNPRRVDYLWARFLLLVLVQSKQWHASYLHDFKSHARNITHGVATATESRDQNLVLYHVQREKGEMQAVNCMRYSWVDNTSTTKQRKVCEAHSRFHRSSSSNHREVRRQQSFCRSWSAALARTYE